VPGFTFTWEEISGSCSSAPATSWEWVTWVWVLHLPATGCCLHLLPACHHCLPGYLLPAPACLPACHWVPATTCLDYSSPGCLPACLPALPACMGPPGFSPRSYLGPGFLPACVPWVSGFWVSATCLGGSCLDLDPAWISLPPAACLVPAFWVSLHLVLPACCLPACVLGPACSGSCLPGICCPPAAAGFTCLPAVLHHLLGSAFCLPGCCLPACLRITCLPACLRFTCLLGSCHSSGSGFLPAWFCRFTAVPAAACRHLPALPACLHCCLVPAACYTLPACLVPACTCTWIPRPFVRFYRYHSTWVEFPTCLGLGSHLGPTIFLWVLHCLPAWSRSTCLSTCLLGLPAWVACGPAFLPAWLRFCHLPFLPAPFYVSGFVPTTVTTYYLGLPPAYCVLRVLVHCHLPGWRVLHLCLGLGSPPCLPGFLPPPPATATCLPVLDSAGSPGFYLPGFYLHHLHRSTCLPVPACLPACLPACWVFCLPAAPAGFLQFCGYLLRLGLLLPFLPACSSACHCLCLHCLPGSACRFCTALGLPPAWVLLVSAGFLPACLPGSASGLGSACHLPVTTILGGGIPPPPFTCHLGAVPGPTTSRSIPFGGGIPDPATCLHLPACLAFHHLPAWVPGFTCLGPACWVLPGFCLVLPATCLDCRFCLLPLPACSLDYHHLLGLGGFWHLWMDPACPPACLPAACCTWSSTLPAAWIFLPTAACLPACLPGFSPASSACLPGFSGCLPGSACLPLVLGCCCTCLPGSPACLAWVLVRSTPAWVLVLDTHLPPACHLPGFWATCLPPPAALPACLHLPACLPPGSCCLGSACLPAGFCLPGFTCLPACLGSRVSGDLGGCTARSGFLGSTCHHLTATTWVLVSTWVLGTVSTTMSPATCLHHLPATCTCHLPACTWIFCWVPGSACLLDSAWILSASVLPRFFSGSTWDACLLTASCWVPAGLPACLLHHLPACLPACHWFYLGSLGLGAPPGFWDFTSFLPGCSFVLPPFPPGGFYHCSFLFGHHSMPFLGTCSFDFIPDPTFLFLIRWSTTWSSTTVSLPFHHVLPALFLGRFPALGTGSTTWSSWEFPASTAFSGHRSSTTAPLGFTWVGLGACTCHRCRSATVSCGCLPFLGFSPPCHLGSLPPVRSTVHSFCGWFWICCTCWILLLRFSGSPAWDGSPGSLGLCLHCLPACHLCLGSAFLTCCLPATVLPACLLPACCLCYLPAWVLGSFCLGSTVHHHHQVLPPGFLDFVLPGFWVPATTALGPTTTCLPATACTCHHYHWVPATTPPGPGPPQTPATWVPRVPGWAACLHVLLHRSGGYHHLPPPPPTTTVRSTRFWSGFSYLPPPACCTCHHLRVLSCLYRLGSTCSSGGYLPACLGLWVPAGSAWDLPATCLPAFLPACLPGLPGGRSCLLTVHHLPACLLCTACHHCHWVPATCRSTTWRVGLGHCHHLQITCHLPASAWVLPAMPPACTCRFCTCHGFCYLQIFCRLGPAVWRVLGHLPAVTCTGSCLPGCTAA